ncbi:unnamed protein product [Lota lota]
MLPYAHRRRSRATSLETYAITNAQNPAPLIAEGPRCLHRCVAAKPGEDRLLVQPTPEINAAPGGPKTSRERTYTIP